MNVEYRTSNVERRTKVKGKNKQRTQARAENRSGIVFPSCFICGALLAVIVACFSFLPTDAFCETDDVTDNLRAVSPDEGRAILEKLGNMREDIRTLQADFVEERIIPSLEIPLKYEGKIYYRNDGFFFMEYSKPIHHILRVQNNEALFFVEGGKTADLVDISTANGIAGNPDIFAINPAKFSGQLLEDKEVYVLKDQKKDAGEKVPGPKLTVSLEKKNLLVKRVRIEDGSGDVTNLLFLNVRTNHDIPKSIASFELPEGVKMNRIHQP